MKFSGLQTILPSDPFASNWETSIAPAKPDSFSFDQLADCVALYIASAPRTDGLYPGELVSVPVQVLPGVNSVTLQWDLMPDEAALAEANAFECDLMYSDGTVVYRLCTNFNFANGGVMEIAKNGGGWIDSGYPHGLIPADAYTTFRVVHTLNTSNKTSSCTGIQIGAGPLFTPAAALGGVASDVGLGWAKIAVRQYQPSLTPKGGACGFRVRNDSIASMGNQ